MDQSTVVHIGPASSRVCDKSGRSQRVLHTESWVLERSAAFPTAQKVIRKILLLEVVRVNLSFHGQRSTCALSGTLPEQPQVLLSIATSLLAVPLVGGHPCLIAGVSAAYPGSGQDGKGASYHLLQARAVRHDEYIANTPTTEHPPLLEGRSSPLHRIPSRTRHQPTKKQTRIRRSRSTRRRSDSTRSLTSPPNHNPSNSSTIPDSTIQQPEAAHLGRIFHHRHALFMMV